MSDLLSVTDLGLLRGERPLFRQLAFALGAGECLLVEGANGAGKTSLLRVLTGLLPPDDGEVRWRGQALRRAGQAFRAELAWYGHRAGLKRDLTAAENLAAEAALRPWRHERQAAVLERLGIAALRDLPAAVLSAGQQRRVALARVLLARATLWLLDEPFTNLDAAGRDLVNELVAEHAQRGGVCVLAAHSGVRDALPTRRLLLS